MIINTIRLRLLCLLLFSFLPMLSEVRNCSDWNECVDLLSVRMSVNLPHSISSDVYNYEEGVVYTYVFNDGGVILFHEGALMQFDMDKYIPLGKDHTDSITIIWGMENGKFWKKCEYKRLRWYYYNVDTKSKKNTTTFSIPLD